VSADRFPLPDTELAATRPFWQAAAREELVIPRCAGCQTFQWYPGSACQRCGHGEMPWTRVSGRGSLFSWAVVERALAKPFADRVPYVSALVALEEAPHVRLVSYVVDCDAADLDFDMPLQAVFRSLAFPGVAGKVRAPFFIPATQTVDTGATR
jgi:uncharacterized OB-fold protein